MLEEFLLPNSNATYNSMVARTYGLKVSIYLGEIMYQYSLKKQLNELIDSNYFTFNRSLATYRTTLTNTDQINLDIKLRNLGIIKGYDKQAPKNVDAFDIISINFEELSNLLLGEDKDKVKSIKKELGTKGGKTLTKQEAIREAIKKSIVCSDGELLNALYGWVDSVMAKPKGFLTNEIVKMFQDDLYKYTQGDLDKALEVVKIATIGGYQNCNWAINSYEKQLENNRLKVRVTEQKKVSKLSDTIF